MTGRLPNRRSIERISSLTLNPAPSFLINSLNLMPLIVEYLEGAGWKK